MSKGLGRVQRTILALIKADPHGAWTIEDLALAIYPGLNQVDKKHRVAILYALRKMKLPGTWAVWWLDRQGRGSVLFDPCDEEGQLRMRYIEYSSFSRSYDEPQSFAEWRQGDSYRVKKARESLVEERRWRDASPIERIDIRIAETQQFCSLMRQVSGNGDLVRQGMERLAALQAEKQALVARAW
jgi:hypothetical protein